MIGTDKGLCGALNANLFRKLSDVDSSAKFVSVGKRATQFLSRTHRDLLADFNLPDKPRYSDIKPIIEFLLRAYYDDKIDTIEVLHTGFVNTLCQEAELVRLFPLNDLDEMSQKLHQRFGIEDHEVPKDSREILIENRSEVLAELGTLYLKQQIHQMVMESQASEHSRMVAMKTATDNAGNLLNDLTLQYNRQDRLLSLRKF